jgi:hypothetical protein
MILIAPLFLTSYAAVAAGQERGDGLSRTYPCYGSTKDWRAWIDATPGPQGPGLVVTGVVTTPTGNNRTFLTLGPTLRSEPPQQIVNLEIRGQGDVVTNMVVTREVRARFPALPRYGAVVIRCNGQEIGRVSPILTFRHPSEEPRPPQPPPPPNTLGDVWEEEEENSWRGTWIRRGESNLFDAYWVHPNGERVLAVLEIRNRAREVKVTRRHPDGQGCDYRGEIDENWLAVHGTYSCSWNRHSSPWRARIVRMQDVSPALLSNGGWRRIQ